MFNSILKKVAATVSILVLSTISHATTLQEYINAKCSSSCVTADQLMTVVYKVSDSYKLSPKAVIAIISNESGFRSNAKNGSSVGLTQVLLRYHKPKFLGQDYYNVEDNVFAGMQILRDCLHKHLRVYSDALSCYNGGGKKGKKYASKVLATMRALEKVELPQKDHDPLFNFIAQFQPQ